MLRLGSACVLGLSIATAAAQDAASAAQGATESAEYAAPPAEDYSVWTHHGEIVLNTGDRGAAIPGDVAGFPLLVRLTGADFPFAQAAANGRDLRFTDATGEFLPHQVDRWDAAAGAAEVWVRVPLIKGNTADQTLGIHWGNASAADRSDGGAVFRVSSGFVSAWHLGGTGNRPNAVDGGNPAVPMRHTGKESSAGVIGLADSLGLGSQGSYLDIGDGYSNFTSGFSFSAWVYPSSVGDFTHIVDLGNGTATDNIVLQRHATTQDLAFVNFGGGAQSNEVRARSGLAQNQWQHLAVTVSGREVKLYRNGVRIMASTLSVPLNGARRTLNFLGRSNWQDDDSFHGKLDEAWLANTPRNPDWIKLSYENQKPGQNLVSFRASTAACIARFGAVQGLTIGEGSTALLAGQADCASRSWWSHIGGLPIRLPDPEAKNLPLQIPRVDRETTSVFRFTAQFGESVASWDVPVRILNTIPDPEFTLPQVIPWNGKEPLTVRPVITNLAALKASAYPELRYTWTVTPMSADTALLPDGILLKSTTRNASMALTLCLDNQGTPLCRTAELRVDRTIAIRRGPGPGAAALLPADAGRDAMGRSGKPASYGTRFILPR